MTRINLGERNELSLSLQAMRYKEEIAEEIKRRKEDKTVVNSNEIEKLGMATELMRQGISEAAICRILNISPDQLPEPLPF